MKISVRGIVISVGVSRMKKTIVVIVEPGAKVNGKYYCEHYLRRGFLPLIYSSDMWSPCITGHYVRTESLSYTARNKINFLLQENVTFFKLDKWQPNSSNLKSVDDAIRGCIARTSLATAKIPEWSIQLKLAIIDEYRNLGLRSIDCKRVPPTLIKSR